MKHRNSLNVRCVRLGAREKKERGRERARTIIRGRLAGHSGMGKGNEPADDTTPEAVGVQYASVSIE